MVPLEPGGVSAWRGEALQQRLGAVAAPSVGSTSDQADRHRVPTPSAGVPELWPDELWGTAAGASQGQSWAQLMALTARLMVYYRQSKRRTAEFLNMLLGQPCSASLTVKTPKSSDGGPAAVA